MDKIATWLWCDGNTDAMATFYTGLIPDSRIVAIVHSPGDNPSDKAGDLLPSASPSADAASSD